MPFFDYGNLCATQLKTYTLKFYMRTAAGAGVAAITSITVWRSKAREFPAAALGAIAVTASPGPHPGSQPSIVEVDPTLFPGLYEFEGAAADIDTKGPASFRFDEAAGPMTSEETYLTVPFLLRESFLTA